MGGFCEVSDESGEAHDLLHTGCTLESPPGAALRVDLMPMPSAVRVSLLSFAAASLIAGAAWAQPSVDGPLPAPLPVLPSNNWWNVDVSQAPVDTNSASFITFIGTTRRLHPDWGGSAHDPDDPNGIYGIPYISVPGTQPLVPVTFVAYGDESDNGAPGRPAPRTRPTAWRPR